MATKEGAERACINKRPIIDGRRANVDLAYIGAKPKTPKESPQQESTIDTKCPSVPSSPTSSEQSFSMVNSTEWDVEEQRISPSFRGNFTFDSVHSVHVASSQAMMISPPVGLKPATVRGIQTVSPTLPPTNTMDYYPRTIQQYSSPGCNTASFAPNYLNHQGSVNLVAYMPHDGHVPTPPEGLPINAAHCQPQFSQAFTHPTKLIPTSPRYVYTVPVWYVDQGAVSCGQISLNQSYSQTPLVSAGLNVNANCGIQAGEPYPMPITYY